MLDTISYIPTILAYAFITLLVVILCFIVVYVSHKIYASVYDYLPMPQSMLLSFLEGSTEEAPQSRKSTLVFIKQDSTMIGRKSKTAMRFIVAVEPCYLAYVVFETEKRSAAATETLGLNISFSDFRKHSKLVKYYDRLQMIPMGKMMQRCDDESTDNVARTSISSKTTAHKVPTKSAKAAAKTPAAEATALNPSEQNNPPNADKNNAATDAATVSTPTPAPAPATSRPTATFTNAMNTLAQSISRPSQ